MGFKLNEFKNENLLLLAEDIGFHIGDGNMHIRARSKKNKRLRYDFVYSGHASKDYDYFLNILIPRKQKLFGVRRNSIQMRKNSEIKFGYTSKEISILFQEMGIKGGKKNNIFVPSWIMKGATPIKTSFLRGFMDSDGSLAIKKRHKDYPYYPVVTFAMKSEKLFDNIKEILSNLGFTFTGGPLKKYLEKTNKTYTQFQIDINGVKNLGRWIKLIGFRNKKHKTKYKKWAGQESNLQPLGL